MLEAAEPEPDPLRDGSLLVADNMRNGNCASWSVVSKSEQKIVPERTKKSVVSTVSLQRYILLSMDRD